MAVSALIQFPVATSRKSSPPTILLGVTHAQTCLILGPRLRALRKAGYRVLLVSSPGRLLNETAAHEKVEAIPVPIERGIAPLSDLLSLFRLWRLIGEYHPDLVEFSTPKAGLLGSLAAWMRGVPHRVYMLRGLKVHCTTGIKRRILLAAERIAARCAQVVLCNSDSLRQEALELRIAPARKLALLGQGSSNGVDTEHFSPGLSRIRRELRIPRSAPVIGFSGRLTRDKGLPELLEAFELIHAYDRNARLLLVGWFDQADDALDPKMQQRLIENPNIICTGFVGDTADYYRAMDILVLPTWREGFPNAVLEAAATGIPVITTASTGARDSVVAEVTGLLVPPGNYYAIFDAVKKLLRDPERRAQMGRAARAWTVAHFSQAHVVGLIVDYYEGLLDERFAKSSIRHAYTAAGR